MQSPRAESRWHRHLRPVYRSSRQARDVGHDAQLTSFVARSRSALDAVGGLRRAAYFHADKIDNPTSLFLDALDEVAYAEILYLARSDAHLPLASVRLLFPDSAEVVEHDICPGVAVCAPPRKEFAENRSAVRRTRGAGTWPYPEAPPASNRSRLSPGTLLFGWQRDGESSG
jgi:hypothetical protein